MPTYINNLCSAPYSLTGASGYKPLLTLEDIAAAIQELTDLQSQLQCCTQTEKDAEAIVFTATPSGTAPNYDWSCEIRLNTCFFAGDVLTVDLTGIPNNFTLDSISPITPATVLINVVAKTLVFTGTVLAGTYFVISGTFDDNVCAAGTATLTIAGDTITANNVVTGTYSGATWCVPPVPPTTTINPTVATLIAPNNNDGGCVGGFISETVTITGGGLNVPVSSFPADLCALLSGLPVTLGTKLLTITSDVATACGTATHAIGITVSEVGGFITQINGTSCTPPPLKDTLVDTDNNANGFGCNAGVLVYPFSIDLTVRGGVKVAVTSDADIIAAYAALPIPIAVTISGCDILLPLGETPTDIETECLYDCYAACLGDCSATDKDSFPINYPDIGNRFNTGDVVSFENVGYNALGSNVIFSYTLSAIEATEANIGVFNIASLNGAIIANILANLNDSIGVSLNHFSLGNTKIWIFDMKISTVHNPANTAIFGQLLINGIVPADATSVNIILPKKVSAQLTPCV